jgi:hypothetical protein
MLGATREGARRADDVGLAHEALDAALRGEAWSLASVIHGFEGYRDDDGRPVFELRAPAGVKEGVPMHMRRCPYADERAQRWINVSALAQVTDHLDAVLVDVAALHAAQPAAAGWERLCVAVMDQLAQPAVHLLRAARPRRAPLPARLSVGYKVSVGYLTPVRDLLTLSARGAAREASLASFLAFLDEGRYLLGTREVCAGPPNLLARVSAAMLGGGEAVAAAPPARVAIARALALQLQVGLVWRLFDRDIERRLLLGEVGWQSLRPRNAFLTRKLAERRAELEAAPAVTDRLALPDALDELTRARLRAALAGRPHADGDGVVALAERLLDGGEGAILLEEPVARARFARLFARYLVAYRVFVDALHALERDLRAHVGVGLDAPVKLDASVFPTPRALGWFELVLGYRLGGPGASVLRNQHREVAVAG